MLPQKWQSTFLQFLAVWLVVALVLVYFFYPPMDLAKGGFILLGAAILVLGFKISIELVGAFTGVKRLSSVTLLVLFLAKLAWWVGIFLGSQHLTENSQKIPLAFGFGAFLLSLLTLVLISHKQS